METQEINTKKRKISIYAIPGLTVGGIDILIPRKYLEIEEIRNIVARYFSIPIYNLDLNTRKREIVEKRQIAHYLSRIHTVESLITIGKAIGNKDHCTVLFSCKSVNNMMDTNSKFKNTDLCYIVAINELNVMIKNRKNKR